MRTSIHGWRRGEGQTEYVIITGMIMVCAVVSLFNFFGAARDIALDKKLCINCEHEDQEVREILGPDGLPVAGTGDAAESPETGDSATGDAPSGTNTVSTLPDALAAIGGAPWLPDLFRTIWGGGWSWWAWS